MHSQATQLAPERIIIESHLGRNAAPLCHGAMVHRAHASKNPLVAKTREELGLPSESLLFMTGHQAEIWHPGILAKYITCSILANHAHKDPAASALSPVTSHVVVDQDTNDGDWLRIPLHPVGRHSLSLSGPERRDRVPMKARPPLNSKPLYTFLTDKAAHLSPHIHSVLVQLATWIDSTSKSSNAADQITKILSLGTQTVTPLGQPVFATSISQTSGFAWLLEQLKAHPNEAVMAYNAAAARLPRARIAPLHISTSEPELTQLPLWHIDPATGQRRTVTVAELTSLAPTTLAPKALLLTAFLRLFVCDLFVHGLGGGLYDQITDQWMASSSWLASARLAPTATVTATLYLPFAVNAPPTPEVIAQAARDVHRSRHDPRIVHADAVTVAKYDQLIEASHQAKSKVDKRAAYTTLHEFLVTYRKDNARAIEQLEAKLALIRERSETTSIVYDRTWPCFFYDETQLLWLQSRIEGQLAGG